DPQVRPDFNCCQLLHRDALSVAAAAGYLCSSRRTYVRAFCPGMGFMVSRLGGTTRTPGGIGDTRHMDPLRDHPAQPAPVVALFLAGLRSHSSIRYVPGARRD